MSAPARLTATVTDLSALMIGTWLLTTAWMRAIPGSDFSPDFNASRCSRAPDGGGVGAGDGVGLLPPPPPPPPPPPSQSFVGSFPKFAGCEPHAPNHSRSNIGLTAPAARVGQPTLPAAVFSWKLDHLTSLLAGPQGAPV
jgi:hypothetical protein